MSDNGTRRGTCRLMNDIDSTVQLSDSSERGGTLCLPILLPGSYERPALRSWLKGVDVDVVTAGHQADQPGQAPGSHVAGQALVESGQAVSATCSREA